MSKRASKIYPKICLLYKMCPSFYKKMGKKIFINKKYKDKTKKYRIVITKNNREGRTKLNRNNCKGRNLPN